MASCTAWTASISQGTICLASGRGVDTERARHGFFAISSSSTAALRMVDRFVRMIPGCGGKVVELAQQRLDGARLDRPQLLGSEDGVDVLAEPQGDGVAGRLLEGLHRQPLAGVALEGHLAGVRIKVGAAGLVRLDRAREAAGV